MRLHNLFESSIPESLTEDIIDIELTEDFAIEGRVLEFTEDGGAIIELDEQALELVDLDEEQLNEFIPLIIGGAALGVSAYDAYKSYKQFKSGAITKGELAKRVGTDAAIGLATGGAAKLLGKGYKAVKNAFKSKKQATVPTGKPGSVQIDKDAMPAAPVPASKVADKVTDRKATKKADDRKKAAKRVHRASNNNNGLGSSNYDNPLQRAIGKISAFGEAEELVDEAEYQGRKVKLGKPMAGDVKKFKVYVKNPKGNVVKVNFGQKGVKIKKNNPARRKSFRARHNCSNPGPRHKARYWSCRKW